MTATAPLPALRLCSRCGQAIQAETESWTLEPSGIRHTTCPISPELRDLPPVPKATPKPKPKLKVNPNPPVRDPAVAGMPVYITIAEAAAVLRVSKDTIRLRIRTGVLPAMRLRGGQTVLIDQEDVLALLEPVSVTDPAL